MMWQLGQQLKTRNIRIDRELGRGGYGITYLAWNIGFDSQRDNGHLDCDR